LVTMAASGWFTSWAMETNGSLAESCCIGF
jgi:hypothetical protein